MTRSWFRSLFGRTGNSRRRWPLRLAVEPLEERAVPAVLAVNINDPTADLPGDRLYAQIQEAVDAASPGDVIKVHAGTYSPVTIAKDNLTIQEATAPSDPVIDAAGGFAGVLVEGNGVILRGLTVQNTSLEEGEAFRITGNNNRLVENVAVYADVGFSLDGATGNRLERNTSNGNFIGFFVAHSDGNTFVGNTANGNFDGFAMVGSDGNRLVNNTANGNERAGFNLTALLADGIGCSGNEFVGNTANENGVAGFRLRLATDNRFDGNTADGNGVNGFDIRLGSTGNEFTGNRARDNGDYGVFLSPDSLDNLFRGMVLSGNGSGDSNVPLG